ncbi:MAG: hypothetical protein ACR2RV_02400 [Verrucomicrobiales bacterium]
MAEEKNRFPHPERLWGVLGLVLVLLLGSWVYRDVGDFKFVQFDDPALVNNNPYVNRGLTADSVRWAFTFQESEGLRAEPLARELWAPLSFLSLALDVQVAGLDPAVHHRVNLYLHLLGTCLAFVFFLRLTRQPLVAGMVAAVFCFHPMHAESVAWISERKDVLSTLFVLATLNLYLAWKLRSGGSGRPLWWGALLCFVLACLAKPMAVVTPLLLLWIDCWLDRRQPGLAAAGSPRLSISEQLRQKAPFLVIMLATGVTTFAMKMAHSAAPSGPGSDLWGRVVEIPFALLFYIERTAWPHYLFPIYERYPQPFQIATLVGVIVVAVVSWGSFWLRERAPEWWFGWGWFIICLLPVIGFAYAGPSFTADRYTYLAHCGLAFAVVSSMLRLVARWPGWWIPVLLLNAFYLSRIAPIAHATAATWENSETLFRQGVRAQPSSGKNWNNLGALLVNQGKVDEGIMHLKRSIELGGMPDAYFNLAAVSLSRGGPPGQAAKMLRECLRYHPDSGAAMEMLGELLGNPEHVGLYDPEESRSLIERGRALQNR